jgi:type IV pilus assembly protein PilE
VSPSVRRAAGFTLAEILTALVVVVVLSALAVPMWRTHLLRTHRGDGRAALIAAQSAQDKFFGAHARYASGAELVARPPQGLGLNPVSERGYYRVDMKTSADGLAFVATARVTATEGKVEDVRCVEMTLDQNGRRRAVDDGGEDRSGDCWR